MRPNFSARGIRNIQMEQGQIASGCGRPSQIYEDIMSVTGQKRRPANIYLAKLCFSQIHSIFYDLNKELLTVRHFRRGCASEGEARHQPWILDSTLPSSSSYFRPSPLPRIARVGASGLVDLGLQLHAMLLRAGLFFADVICATSLLDLLGIAGTFGRIIPDAVTGFWRKLWKKSRCKKLEFKLSPKDRVGGELGIGHSPTWTPAKRAHVAV